MDAALGGYEPRTATVRVETPSGPGAMTYLDFGDADRPVDVVFLHANGFNARSYRSILAPLADRLRIVAPDQRGHGATALGTATEGRTSWHDMKDDLLAFLANNIGLALSRQQLLDGVWGAGWYGDDRTVDAHVRQLRKKLGDALPLSTVWGMGYRLG